MPAPNVMKTQILYPSRSVRALPILTFLCLILLSSSPILAQKKPLIFKTDEDPNTPATCGASTVATTSAYNLTNIHELERCYKTHFKAGDYTQAGLERNTLIFIAREEIDAVFQESQEKSTKWHDRLQFLFDFLEIGTASAITITNGERAKSVLGDVLALFQGSRAAFNKDFRFLEQQIIANKMAANRAAILTDIFNNSKKDASLYAWETARGDLQNYLFAGTVSAALRTLNADTGKEASDNKAKLDVAKRNAGIVGAPTKQQIDLAKENFDALRKLDEQGETAEAAIVEENKKATPNSTTIDQQKAIVEKTLKSYRSAYALIEADSLLAPLLEKIPEEFPQLKQKSEEILKKLKENPNDVTIKEFDFILTKLNAVVVRNVTENPSLNGRLKNILESAQK